MKTNHARGFVARQDFPAGSRMINRKNWKLSNNRRLRAMIKRELSKFWKGIDFDFKFPVPNKVENPWNWE